MTHGPIRRGFAALRTLALAALVPAALTSCAATHAGNPKPAEPNPNEPATSHIGGPWPPVPPVELMPDAPVTGRCELVKDGETRIADFILEPHGEDAWTMKIEGHHLVRWELRDDGALCLPWQETYGEGVRVEYDPVLVLLPPEGSGAVRTEAKMHVTNLDDGSTKTRGDVVYTVEPAGPDAFDKVVEHQIDLYGRSTMEIDVTLAKAHVVAETAYARGKGPVAEDVTRTVRPLNLFPMTTETTMRRLIVAEDATGDPLTHGRGSLSQPFKTQ